VKELLNLLHDFPLILLICPIAALVLESLVDRSIDDFFRDNDRG